MDNKELYGFTMPLILDSTGKKFGKSEGNALWLSKEKTSAYKIYQYLLNTDDSKVVEYLKVFTFLSKEEILELEKMQKECPEKRIAQKTLAKEVVRDIHGELELDKAVRMSEALFNGEFNSFKIDELEEIFSGYEQNAISKGINIVDMLILMKVATSKREAREFVSGNAISINGEKVNSLDYVISEKDFLCNKYMVVKRGKKNYYIGVME